jgi:hypothetical protein
MMEKEDNTGFPGTWEAHLCDKDDKPVLCSCGAEATGLIIGQNGFMVWCDKCSPLSKEEAT